MRTPCLVTALLAACAATLPAAQDEQYAIRAFTYPSGQVPTGYSVDRINAEAVFPMLTGAGEARSRHAIVYVRLKNSANQYIYRVHTVSTVNGTWSDSLLESADLADEPGIMAFSDGTVGIRGEGEDNQRKFWRSLPGETTATLFRPTVLGVQDNLTHYWDANDVRLGGLSGVIADPLSDSVNHGVVLDIRDGNVVFDARTHWPQTGNNLSYAIPVPGDRVVVQQLALSDDTSAMVAQRLYAQNGSLLQTMPAISPLPSGFPTTGYPERWLDRCLNGGHGRGQEAANTLLFTYKIGDYAWTADKQDDLERPGIWDTAANTWTWLPSLQGAADNSGTTSSVTWPSWEIRARLSTGQYLVTARRLNGSNTSWGNFLATYDPLTGEVSGSSMADLIGGSTAYAPGHPWPWGFQRITDEDHLVGDGELMDSNHSPTVQVMTRLPTLSLSASASTLEEGAGSVNLTATRTGSTTYEQYAWIRASGTADFNDLVATGLTIDSSKGLRITIPAGETSSTISISAQSDAPEGGSQSLVLSLQRPSSGTYDARDRFRTGSSSSVTIAITDPVPTNPQPVITRGGSGTTKDPLTITVTFNEAVTGVASGDLTASAGALSNFQSVSSTVATWTWTPPAGATGSATFSVAASAANATDDNAASQAATDLAVNYDTQAPSISAPTLASGSDSGAIDGITRFNTPVIQGTAEAGATVCLFDAASAGTLLGSATATGGTWSITTSVLADGARTIYAEAVDAVGNVSTRSGPLNLTIDTVAPALSVTTQPAATVNVTAPAWAGTAEAGCTVSAQIVNGATTTSASATLVGTNWSASPTLAEGSNAVTWTSTDAAGNATSATTVNVLVETVGPVVTLSGPVAVRAGVDAVVTATYSDAGSGVAAISLNVIQVQIGFFTGTARYSAASVTGSGLVQRTITLTGLTGEGSISISVQAGTGSDNASNLAQASNTLVVQVDNTAPAAPTISLATASDSGSSNSDRITNVRRPTVQGTAEAGSTITLTGTGATAGALGSATAGNTGAWSVTVTQDLGEGDTVFAAISTDPAGNASSATNLTVTVDATAPAAPTIAAAGPSTNTTPTITGTNEAGATVAVTIGSTTAAAVVSGTTWSYTPVSALAEGTTSISAVQTDLAGNASAAGTGQRTVDTTAPTVTLAAPSVASVKTGGTVTVVATYAGADTVTLDGTRVTVATTGTATATAAVSGSAPTFTITLTGITGDGTVQIGIQAGTASDLAGNSALASNTQTVVIDSTAPAVAVNGGSVTVESQRPAITGTVEASATVEVLDGAVVLGSATVTGTTWTFTPAADLALGAHTISARATDAAGNQATSSSVTVTLVAPPPNAGSDGKCGLGGGLGLIGLTLLLALRQRRRD